MTLRDDSQPAPVSHARPALGVDVGGTSIKAVLVRDGRVELERQSKRYAHPSADELGDALQTMLQAGMLREPIASVGLCVPGVVDPSTRRVTMSVNMPGLVGASLDDLLAHAMGPRWPGSVSLASDAQAAATDYWAGSEPALTGRLVAVSLGTGVGACVLDDGVPLRVAGMSSGHLGQIDVSLDDHAPIGPDGGRGSLEAYIGLPALRAAHGRSVGSWFEHAQLNDPPIRALVRALRVAHAIYRPDHIALLGGVGIELSRSPIGGAIHGAVADQLTRLARPDWTLGYARSTFHAAAGVARLSTAPATG